MRVRRAVIWVEVCGGRRQRGRKAEMRDVIRVRERGRELRE